MRVTVLASRRSTARSVPINEQNLESRLMARILSSRDFGLLIDLDGNVGPRGGNERSDVGIVQFALRLLTEGEPTPFGRELAALTKPAGLGPIGIDGFFGPQTKTFIDTYQALRVRSPGPSTNALPRPDGNFGHSQKTSWNFVLLEDEFKRPMVDQLRFDPRAPAFLKPFFLMGA